MTTIDGEIQIKISKKQEKEKKRKRTVNGET